MAEVKTKSVAQARRISCYPPPKYHTLIKGYATANEMKNSEAITEIVRSFFDNMPEQRRLQCLNEGVKIVNPVNSKHHY